MKNLKSAKIYKRYPVLLAFLFSMSLTALQAQEVDKKLKEVDKTKVCMVDDEFKGEEQLSTKINDKIYFGCCEPCIETLNTDLSFRQILDKYSGKKIYKADAYVVKKPNNKVLYFESKKNYKAYLKKQ